MVGIYKITNPKGKIYIGQSTNLEARRGKYQRCDCKGQPKIYNSIKKYGWKNHIWEIICECREEELNEKERGFQELYKTVETGLNLVYTQTNEKRYKISQEVKDRMSLAKKGKPGNSRGKKRSLETKKKISESRKGEKNWRYGTKHSEDTIKKMQKPKSEVGKLNIKNGAQNRPIVICPYCNVSGQYNAMQRWHFDHCKNKVY